MIVVDEQLRSSGVEEGIARWYRGRVANLTSLRPRTVIKDDAVPVLLRRVPGCTFVTIDARDFWRRLQADERFCVVCFPLPDDRATEIPELLRRLFCLAPFATKGARSGKVARITQARIRYYEVGSALVHSLGWRGR